MKKSKILLSLTMCIAVIFSFSGCGNAYSGLKFSDYIKLADYKGIEIDPLGAVNITDEEVAKEITSRLEAKAETKNVKEGTVADGDTINVDYVGSIDGKEFDGGSEKGRDLTIGSDTFIDGFEDGLIGAKVGATTNVKVTFPKDYSVSDLAGKNAIFAVKVNSKQVKTVPELNEDFVKENSDVKTVEDYKAEVKKELEKAKKQELEETRMSNIWSNIVEKTTMEQTSKKKDKYPDEILDEEMKTVKEQYESAAKQNNLSFSDYISQNFNMDEDTFNNELEKYAKSVIKENLVLYAIAEKEDIELSGDEYDEYKTNTLATYGYTEDSFKEAYSGKTFEQVQGKENIERAALKNKVQKWIIKNAKEKSSEAGK